MALTSIKRYTGFFLWLEENEWAKLLLGAALTTVVVAAFNIGGDWLCGKLGISSSILMGGVETMDKFSMVLGAFFSGFGMVLRSLGIPFYTSDEIRVEIGKFLNSMWAGVGDVWNMIMGFKIPFIGQTLFDVLLGLTLGGPMEVLGDTVIGLIINEVVAPVMNKMLIEAAIAILENYI